MTDNDTLEQIALLVESRAAEYKARGDKRVSDALRKAVAEIRAMKQ